MRQIPYGWAIETWPPTKKLYDTVRARILNDPPEGIAKHKQNIAFITAIINYMKLGDLLKEQYAIARDLGKYTILVRNKRCPYLLFTPIPCVLTIPIHRTLKTLRERYLGRKMEPRFSIIRIDATCRNGTRLGGVINYPRIPIIIRLR